MAADFVPIRSLDAQHRPDILRHLLALEPQDRYLRFGYLATDEQLSRYVEALDFERDEVFGIYNRRLELIAVAHLAFAHGPRSADCAEFGVSVLHKARGRGYGKRLFDRAVVNARNEGVDLLFIQALSENAAMLAIARKAGATLEREGSETEGRLRLPPATLDSRVGELMDEHIAHADYQLKARARNVRRFLDGVQEIRDGVRDARRKSGQ
jgi:RimJ/RimL family protein N-acetyltransferase